LLAENEATLSKPRMIKSCAGMLGKYEVGEKNYDYFIASSAHDFAPAQRRNYTAPRSMRSGRANNHSGIGRNAYQLFVTRYLPLG
jgi:hypothetical protein